VDAVLIFLVFVAVMSGISILATRSMNAARQRSIAEWSRWTVERGLDLSGDYPAFAAHGVIDGIHVSVVHSVHVGGKGQASYRFLAYAVLRTDLGALQVKRLGAFSRMWRALAGEKRDDPPRQEGSGMLSIAESGALGTLAIAEETSGALAVAEDRGEDPYVPPPPLPKTNVAEFERYYSVEPKGAERSLSANVRRALLDAGDIYIERGLVCRAGGGALSAKEAEQTLDRLVTIAAGLDVPLHPDPKDMTK
jgi:hypothetical protein